MENNENIVTETPVEQEVTQPAAQPAEKKNFTDTVKDFSEKMDLEGKSKALMAGGTKVWNKMKALPKKAWMMIGIGAAVLVAAILLIAHLNNIPTTPVNKLQKYYNAKSYKTQMEWLKDSANGFAKSELNKIISLMKKTEDYKEDLKDAKEDYKESVANMKEEYGSNYKYTFKVEDKEKMDKDDLKDYRDTVRSRAKTIVNNLEEFIDDADSSDWEDLADELGLSKSQAKELVKTCLKLAKKLKSVKITDGYELDVVRTLKGKEVDDMEYDMSLTVVKVDGKWMSTSTLSSLLSLASSIG